MKNYISPIDKASIYIARRIEELQPYEADREVSATIKSYKDAKNAITAFCKNPNLTVEEAVKNCKW